MTEIQRQAAQIVESFLELSMVPDPVGASRFMAPDVSITFTGGRRMASPADSTEFNA